MAGLHLYTGNRLENLMRRLADRMRDQPLPPLRPEVIVVQSQGMQKWLSLQLADAHGVFANVAYLFPKTLAQTVFAATLAAGETAYFSPEVLTWSVMGTLPGLLDDPAFKSLRHYLREDPSGVNLFQLSRQIADVLGRYGLLRPDFIMAWRQGRNPAAAEPAARWQAVLWRKILDQVPPEARDLDPAALRRRFLTAPGPLPGIPDRLSVFGISTLAPYYVDVLLRLAREIDVDVYYMNPCRHYWEYVFSEKELLRFTADGLPEEALYLEGGNRLLASLGVAGREFFSLLLSRVGDGGHDLFADPGCADMLSTLQSDVLNLVDDRREPPWPLAPDDRSIQVHSCYSPIREVEALHDILLSILTEDADVQPRDVVVMMPDVSAYAPLIQAVFDNPEEPSGRLVYSIADASVRQVNALAEALLALLDMDRNRYGAARVLDLLETPAVRNRFGLDEAELARVKEWVRASGIRWGIDGRYRTELGLPDFHENTWAFGLDRMLLAHALPPTPEGDLFAGILPWGRFEEDDSRTLGKLAGFARTLFERCRSLKTPKDLLAWSRALDDLLDDFFLPGDESAENDMMEIRRLLADEGLAGLYSLSGFRGTVSLAVIRDYLEARLAGLSRTSGFISNGVTFCTLLPMRSIPFKVVCMLGMNDGAFPRVSLRPGFDLLEKQRRPCDFSKTFEDRYLFLESLLSARKRLVISYVGQNIRDNSRVPPSSLVCELLEYLDRRFTAADGNVSSRVVVHHPLQPFSPKYFQEGGKLLSYSAENLAAARRNLEPKTGPRALFAGSLPEPAGEWGQPLELRQLIAFFKNPAAFLLNRRLRLDLTLKDRDRVEDREPFSLDGLERYLIRQDLVETSLRLGRNEDRIFESLKASGRVPHGSLGRIALTACDREARRFLETLAPHLAGGRLPAARIACRLNDSRKTVVQGVLDGRYAAGQLIYRCARVRAVDILGAWLYHLTWNATDNGHENRVTRLIGTDRLMSFPETTAAEATARLTGLADLFFQGLRAPLPFFPESSLALGEAIAAGKSSAEARNAALRQWRTGRQQPGEGDEVHVSRCFDEETLAGEGFYQIALAVYGPILRQLAAGKTLSDN